MSLGVWVILTFLTIFRNFTNKTINCKRSRLIQKELLVTVQYKIVKAPPRPPTPVKLCFYINARVKAN